MSWRDIPVRAWFAALALGMFGLVAVGLGMQHMLRLAPCPLCIFQRLLYLAIGASALLGVLAPAAGRLWSIVIALLASGGVAVAGYQSWMQAYPHLAPECSFTDPNAIERVVDWLGMEWPSLFLATGFCTSREWEFIGLSMANWSLLIFVGILACAAWLFRCRD